MARPFTLETDFQKPVIFVRLDGGETVTLDNADALVILTEWNIFRQLPRDVMHPFHGHAQWTEISHDGTNRLVFDESRHSVLCLALEKVETDSQSSAFLWNKCDTFYTPF